MFATGLILEREPLQWAEFPGLFRGWVQNAGGVSALCIALYCLAYALQRPAYARKEWTPTALGFALAGVAAGVLYAVLALFYVGAWLEIPLAENLGQGETAGFLATLAGALAILAVVFPIVGPWFTRMRWRRIWALAKLSLKEAVRRRVVLILGTMALVFLFADWFVKYKREDQVRNYVRVVYWSMAPLFLMTASLLGAFSIPNDVRNQSIHTIVTKPVERFEIVLGRFLGYGLILTIGLAVLSALSLLYVVRGVTPEAAQESYKARVPIFGRLGFYGTEGENVGREWDYRKYISGNSKQYAVWLFDSLPSDLGEQQTVPVEFTFDIFRLTKGEENKDIPCTFSFSHGSLPVAVVEKILEKMKEERSRLQNEIAKKENAKRKEGLGSEAIQDWRAKEYEKIEAELLATYAVYERPFVDVTDYHTQTLKVPGSFFRSLMKLSASQEGGPPAPPLQVLVSVDRVSSTAQTQMLGVAKRDLYVLAAERPFWINFLKGIIGMWFTFMLVLGLAVACSTYLSGVISWLCTLFLFGAGLFADYIQQLAEKRAIGGGPMEAAWRLVNRQPIGVPLEETPTTTLFTGADEVYRWMLRRLLNIIPDVSRFDLHHYVANGFDISWSQVLLLDNFIPLVGYLLPWGVLAFYLLKFREIANPT